MNIRLLVIAATLLASSACAGDDGGEKVAAADTPPTSAAATVSVQTTCDLLFIDADPRLWSQAVTLVKKAQAGQAWDSGESGEVARRLTEVAESSREDLRP